MVIQRTFPKLPASNKWELSGRVSICFSIYPLLISLTSVQCGRQVIGDTVTWISEAQKDEMVVSEVLGIKHASKPCLPGVATALNHGSLVLFHIQLIGASTSLYKCNRTSLISMCLPWMAMPLKWHKSGMLRAP